MNVLDCRLLNLFTTPHMADGMGRDKREKARGEGGSSLADVSCTDKRSPSVAHAL